MAETDTQADSNRPGAFISERHRNPEEMMVQRSQGNNLLAGICAIVATVVFIALLVLLWTDWSALQVA